MKKLLIIICAFFCLTGLVKAAEDFAPSAKSAILIDFSTGKILFEKNADEKLAPASMTKVMSMLLIMEAIDSGKINYDDEVTISKESASMGGSQIFLQEGETYKVSELLKGIAIASGNDAVVAMAEKVAGSVSAFVEMMNKKSIDLGLHNTNFINPHGLDEENHYSSSRDMSIMARELLNHEDILKYTSIYEEYLTKNDGTKTWLVNTNKLVRFYKGADGLKTGFTSEAGYCLTATATKGNMRLISVVMKENTINTRSEDTVRMLNYGFNSYKTILIKNKDESLGKVHVEKGKNDFVDIVLVKDATELLSINDNVDNYSFNIVVDKIIAPVYIGNIVGHVDIIDNEGNVIDSINLTVKENIEKSNFWDYIKKNIKIVTGGKLIINND